MRNLRLKEVKWLAKVLPRKDKVSFQTHNCWWCYWFSESKPIFFMDVDPVHQIILHSEAKYLIYHSKMSFFHLKFRCYWSLTIILPNHNNSTQQSQNVSRSWTMETTSSWACVQPRPVWRFAVTVLGGLYSLARDVLRTELLHFYKKGVFHFDKSPPDISLVTSTITAKFML